MPKPKRRKLEVYRLTISGLKANVDYLQLLRKARSNIKSEQAAVHTTGDKSHALHEAKILNESLWLRFFSYSSGDRPDIINTTSLDIKPTPLETNETQLYWTHALVSPLTKRMVMLVERVQMGIWPSRIEGYLQWLIEHPMNKKLVAESQGVVGEPITVTLELEADKSFMRQVEAMDRIISASVRIVRPNPGWKDYEDLLSKEAQASDAHYADVSMHARRNASLAKTRGIVQAMKDLDKNHKLGRAEIEGDTGGERKVISTEKFGKSQYKCLPTNSDGNVDHDAALDKFFEYLGEVD